MGLGFWECHIHPAMSSLAVAVLVAKPGGGDEEGKEGENGARVVYGADVCRVVHGKSNRLDEAGRRVAVLPWALAAAHAL